MEVGGTHHSMGAIPKSRLLPQLGMLLANSSLEDRTHFFQTLPPPIGLLNPQQNNPSSPPPLSAHPSPPHSTVRLVTGVPETGGHSSRRRRTR